MPTTFNLFAFLCLISFTINSNPFIDFSYSQFIQNEKVRSIQPAEFRIKPDEQKLHDLTLPEVCELKSQLDSFPQESIESQLTVTQDEDLKDMKQKVMEILVLSEKIKKTNQNIKQLEGYIENKKLHQKQVNFDEDLSDLESQQQQLRKIKRQIDSNIFLMNQMMNSSRKTSGNEGHSYALSAVQFQIESLRLKIDYLNKLRLKAEKENKEKVIVDYDDFYKNLEEKFTQERNLVNEIDKIIGNYSKMSYLKSKIASVNSHILSLNLYIEEKQNCSKKRDEIKENRTPAEINDTINDLRQKKKQFGNMPNKYCEGIAKKLQSQIKKILRVYNWTFLCSQGLQQLERQKQKQQINLDKAKKELQLIENLDFNHYQQNYNKTEKEINDKFEQMKKFTINKYTHNPEDINKLIQKAREQKELAEKKKQSMSVETAPQPDEIDEEDLIDLKDKISKEKANYCRMYEKYMKKSRKLENKVMEFEEKENFAYKMRNYYLNEVQKLRSFEQQFNNHKNLVISLLEGEEIQMKTNLNQ